ncbi:MAG: bifunctional metallophosphatase/5'-nucleotidase [Thiotrichales bacterium]|nr:bifunctional metallophosphatase/5'-nucleotidase [Thiotrichales bacterium]
MTVVRKLLAPALVGLLLAPISGFAASESEPVEIRILGTNDLHSYLRPLHYRYLDEIKPWGRQSREGDFVAKAALQGKLGGMANVAAVIERLRAEKPDRTLLLDAGDTWHGAGISVFDKGVTMVKIMNAIGYDVMAPGNWEFIYDKDHLLDLIDMAEFPVVAYNVMDPEWDEPAFPQYVIKEVGGLKVAVIGLAYPWTALTSSVLGSAGDWKFGIREEEARELIAEIREEEDPDLVVVTSHGGFGMDQKFARRVDGVDVLLSGHTHDEIYDPVVWNDTIVYQGGAHGKFVTALDVKVKDKKVVGYSYDLVMVRPSEVEPHPEVQRLVDEAYGPHEARLNEVVGANHALIFRRDFWQSPMGGLLTDALRAVTGAEISFFPAWRYGATLLPGPIAVEDVYNLVPTDGRIVTYSMSGKSIERLMENILDGVVDTDPYARVGGDMIQFSGMELVYDLYNTNGERVVSLSVGGQPIEPERLYSVASVHTRFQNNMLFGAQHIDENGPVFVEALIEYIRDHSPLRPITDRRIRPRGSDIAGS